MLEYLRDALRECLQLPADAPDEDLIDTLRERLTRADVERYDAATVSHIKDREREYMGTIWAAANALWPEPLRVSAKARAAWSPQCQIQTRTDHQSRDLLIYGVPEKE